MSPPALASGVDASMTLKEVRHLIGPSDVEQAARLVRKHCKDGFEWLYRRTGREEPQSRYIVVDGDRFPTKAFGFLVAQVASGLRNTSNDMTSNEAAAPLRKLGYTEVPQGTAPRNAVQEATRKVSYCKALARPRQACFRETLRAAYGACAVSEVATAAAVEAAHVLEFARDGLDHLSNGILLRCDLHSLFDAGEMAVDPATMKLHFSKGSRAEYSDFDGKEIEIPAGGPAPSAFQERWDAFAKRGGPSN